MDFDRLYEGMRVCVLPPDHRRYREGTVVRWDMPTGSYRGLDLLQVSWDGGGTGVYRVHDLMRVQEGT